MSGAHGRQPKPRAVGSAVESADLRKLRLLASPRLPYCIICSSARGVPETGTPLALEQATGVEPAEISLGS